MERVVVALGGNALLRRGADDTFDEMYRAARAAAERIADIAAEGWEVVVTHGNGPQVGRILIQQEAAAKTVSPMPLDVCGAESQGLIGYLLQVTIGDVFFERGMERPVATVLSLTRVRPQDPAFRKPTKFIGPFYTAAQARKHEEQRGWVMKEDPHGGWRRVVPSPRPYSIVETPVVKRLVADGVIVIAGGGGGVPVIEKGPRLIGKEGVVDKDLAAAILAAEVEATTLLILTDVEKVQRGFGTLYPEPIDRMTADEAGDLLKRGEFGAGSMGPKVQAAIDFLEAGGSTRHDRRSRRRPRGAPRRGGHRDRARVSDGPPSTPGDVATWNVHGLRGGVRAVAEVVRAEAVDVLLVQESGSRRRLRELGEELAWSVVADPPAFPRRRVQNAVLRPNGAGGISARSRLVRFAGWFPGPSARCAPRRARRAVDRRVGAPRTSRAGARHDTWPSSSRSSTGRSGSFVLGGDLNALPGEPGPTRLAALATDCWAAAGDGSRRQRSRRTSRRRASTICSPDGRSDLSARGPRVARSPTI